MPEKTLFVRVEQTTPVPIDLQFSCGPGDVLAIFGPSGSGKTTVLRAIAGLATPTRTSVRVGTDVWTDTDFKRSLPPHLRRVGYVFQEYALFPHLSARGNVEIALGDVARGDRRQWAHDLLRKVHLAEPQFEQPVHTLSGGERQRVALARALGREPRVLLLDEPFAAVDRDVRKILQDEVDSLRRALTIPTILVTHDLGDVFRLATHVLVLDRGRVVINDTLAAVTSHPDAGALRQLIGSGSVFDAALVRRDDTRGLAYFDIGGVELIAPAMPVAVGARVRLRIAAREVILATERPTGLSLHNTLPAVVRAVQDAPQAAHAVVQLTVGGVMLLSEVTRDAVGSLGITPGRTLFALIKSMSVDVVGSDTPVA